MLTKLSPCCRKMFLLFLSHSFQGPNSLPGDVVTVNYNKSLGKTNLGDLTEMRIHVDDNVLNLFPVLKTAEIPDHIHLLPVRKNIYALSILGVGKDRLVFLSTGIAFKFVDRHYLWTLLARVIDQVEITKCCRGRDIMLSGDVLQ